MFYPVRQVWAIPFAKGVQPLAKAPKEALPPSAFNTDSLVILTKEGIYTGMALTRHTGVNRQTGQMYSSFIRMDDNKERLPFIVHYAYE